MIGKSFVYFYHQTVNSLLRVIFAAIALASSVFRVNKVRLPAHAILQGVLEKVYLCLMRLKRSS